MKRSFLLFLALVLLTTLLLQSCQKKERVTGEENTLKVVTTLFPLYEFAKNVGQQRAEVSLLLPPGVEPHAFEPRPADMKRIHGSDLLIFTGKYMEPWVDTLLKGIDTKSLSVVDTSKDIILIQGHHTHDEADHNHTDTLVSPDPHVWLDFSNAMKMVDSIAAAYMARDPQNKDFYRKNAEEYKKKLEELDRKYKDALSHCRNSVIIHAGHFAFGYLAKRYNLKYVSAFKGFAPDAEPTPKRLVELVDNVKKHNVRSIYYEELITPKVAEAISKETGCSLLMLHGAHNIAREEAAGGVTFLQLMENNLENLRVGLQCR
jgi:zinc transport system substrate-binding protein